MNKNIKCALAVMFAVAGLASCDDSAYEYTAPAQVSGPQVFFATSNPSTIELEALSGSFSLPITRVDSVSEATVPLTVKCTFDGYTIPQSVTFEAGKSTADINISYAGLEYDLMDTITISLPEEIATPYGNSIYTVVVGCPAPWTPWFKNKAEWVNAGMDADAWPLSESESTCTYTYTNYWSGDDSGLPISYRQSTIDETAGQFKIEHWGSDMDFFIEYNTATGDCQVLPQYVTENENYGSVYISDIPHYSSQYSYQQFPCYYDKTTGKFVLYTVWYVSKGLFGNDAEFIQVDGFYIPDYSVNAVFEGTLTDASQNTYALLNVASLGVDVQSVKALVVTKDDDAAAVADAIAAGEVEAVDLVLGNNKLELGNMTGELQIVAVSMAEGEVKVVESYGFEYYGSGNASPWKTLGKALYTDDIILPFFTQDGSSETYEVEIQENNERPGLYRLVDPYGPKVHPYYEALVGVNVSMPSSGKYLVVNACDPEGVYVEHQSLGVDWGEGEAGFVSEGARYISNYPFETIKQAGLFGKMENGIITFPSFDITENDQPTGNYYQGFVTLNGSLAYYCGMNKSISITLPDAVTPSAVKKAQKSQVRSMQGNFAKRSMFEVGTAKRVNRILVPREMK